MLGYEGRSEIDLTEKENRLSMHGRRELNPQPPDLESGALPIELLPCGSTAGARATSYEIPCAACAAGVLDSISSVQVARYREFL